MPATGLKETLLLFLAWNQKQKKNLMEQNLFQIEQKLLLKEQKMFVNENCVQSENINALYFPVASPGYVWPFAN